MVAQIDLKEIERKAYRSTYEDGLWDIYLGLVVAAMAIFVYRPVGGYRPANVLLAILIIRLLHVLFRAAKRLVTLPRIGQVRFGSLRKQRKAELAAVLGLILIVQVGILLLSLFGWLNPQTGSKINSFHVDRKAINLLVACLGATFVGVGMAVNAYFNDFSRGYTISLLMSLAVFLMIWLNQPVYPIIIGVIISLYGGWLFVKFMRKYPLQTPGATDE